MGHPDSRQAPLVVSIEMQLFSWLSNSSRGVASTDVLDDGLRTRLTSGMWKYPLPGISPPALEEQAELNMAASQDVM